ncbi:MAG: hypothetical protein R3265_09715 [Hyphomonas sp.]|nr:hypothetical protein [Hyphomonas sp.]
MSEVMEPKAAGTPWHLWVVGVLAVLWNAIGAFDFTATVTHWAPYMSNFTEEQQAFFYSFPIWQYAIWAVGVWGAFIGSILLLLRSRYAVWAFAVSLVAALASMIHGMSLKDVPEGASNPAFAAIIILIGALLLAYAWWMTRRGVLR